jgi:hypothetical protein
MGHDFLHRSGCLQDQFVQDAEFLTAEGGDEEYQGQSKNDS